MRAVPDNFRRLLARAVSGQPCRLHGWRPGELYAAARRHGLVPLLDLALHEHRLEGCAPLDREQLSAHTRRLAAETLAREHSDRGLFELLDRAAIPVLLLKGAALSRLHYPQPYLRTRCDTDLYLRAEDRPLVEALLERAGYVQVQHERRPLTSTQFQAARERFQGDWLWFDLHTAPSNRVLFRATLPYDACHARARTVPGLPGSVRALSDADLMVHACLHRIGHARGADRDRLIWLYDLHLLAISLGPAGLEVFAERALVEGLGALCADAINACRGLFGTPVPEGLTERLTRRRTTEATASLIHAPPWRWLWSDINALQGWKNRLRFMREVAANRLGRA